MNRTEWNRISTGFWTCTREKEHLSRIQKTELVLYCRRAHQIATTFYTPRLQEWYPSSVQKRESKGKWTTIWRVHLRLNFDWCTIMSSTRSINIPPTLTTCFIKDSLDITVIDEHLVTIAITVHSHVALFPTATLPAIGRCLLQKLLHNTKNWLP